MNPKKTPMKSKYIHGNLYALLVIGIIICKNHSVEASDVIKHSQGDDSTYISNVTGDNYNNVLPEKAKQLLEQQIGINKIIKLLARQEIEIEEAENQLQYFQEAHAKEIEEWTAKFEVLKEYANRAFQAAPNDPQLAAIKTAIDTGDFETARQFLLALHKKEKEEEQARARAKTSFQLAIVFDLLVNYETAYTFYEESIQLDPENVEYLNRAGLLALRLARYDYAEACFRQCVKTAEQKESEHHSRLGTFLNNLAGVLANTNRLNEAEPLFRRALKIHERSLGKNHPQIATDLNNLANLLHDTNRLKEAESLYRRALKILEEQSEINRPEIALSINNLALLLVDTNRLEEAAPLLRRALKINERFLPPNHPHIARAQNNLASLLHQTNRNKEAEALFRRSLKIYEKTFGKNHPSVASTLNNLALLLDDTNRFKEAESLLRRALNINENALGRNHPDVANNLNNLAMLLWDTNRLKEAEPLLRRALDIEGNALGKKHPQYAIYLRNLAELLKTTDRLEEAEPLYRSALDIEERSLGKNNPTFAKHLYEFAGLLRDMNRHEEVEPLLRRVLDILKKSRGEDHPDVKTVERSLNILLQELRMTEEYRKKAEESKRRMLVIRYNMAQPRGETAKFVDKLSFNGFGLDYRFFLLKQLSVGLAFTWNTFEKKESGTYPLDTNTTLSGTRIKTTHLIQLAPSIQYHFRKQSSFAAPFVGLNAGPYYTSRVTDWSSWYDEESSWQFGFSSEVGIRFGRLPLPIYAALSYAYAVKNKDIPDQQTFGIGVGIAVLK